eukprot:scaffold41992_cov168-Amphora_coffeaeformis.AAC.2
MVALRSLLYAEMTNEKEDKVKDRLDSNRRRSTKVYNFRGKRRQLVRMPSKEDVLQLLQGVSLADDDDSNDDSIQQN